MKIIRELSKISTLILKEPKVLNKNNYRWLTYILKVPIEEGMILTNLLTGQMLLLDESETQSLNGFTDDEVFKKLVNYWMVVPIGNNDRALYDTFYHINLQFTHHDYINHFKILTTSDCNARCFYCFEHGAKRYNMTEETALDIAKYIQKVSKGQKVSIHWFGGEPLFNTKPIDIIVDYLNENSITFDSEMTSNGYLFDDNIIEKAKNKWLMKNVQITLDGTQDTYNRIKAYIYKDEKNPFLKVINNIKKLISNEIVVYIRINFGDHNEKDSYDLVDFVESAIGKSPYLHVYSWNIHESTLKGDMRHNQIQLDQLYRKQIALENYILEKELKIIKPFPENMMIQSCMAEDDSSVVVFPNGNLGKCDHFLDTDFIGSVYSNEPFDKNIINEWRVKKSEIELCSTCSIFPYCRWLKKCPANGSEICTEGYIEFRINLYKAAILKVFNDWKKNNNEDK